MLKRDQPQKPADKAPDAALSGYWSGAHTTHLLRFHLVWTPKYRKRVLEGAIAVRVEELFRQACEVNNWQLHEINVQPDHIHLLIQFSPRLALAKVVNQLKGGSSRIMRQEFPKLEEFLWGRSFWCDGYFAESIGPTKCLEGICV